MTRPPADYDYPFQKIRHYLILYQQRNYFLVVRVLYTHMFSAQPFLALSRATLGIIEALVGLRVLLKFLGASSQAPFVSWIYDTSQPLLKPFENMFPTSRLSGNFVLEISAIFALLTYAFTAYLIEEFTDYLSHHFPTKTNS